MCEISLHYRSDWPEVGWSRPLKENVAAHQSNNQHWRMETIISGVKFRWVVIRSEFESNLYRLPIWSLHLEIEELSAGEALTPQLEHPILQKALVSELRQLLHAPPWGKTAYVVSKLLKTEPLYQALLHAGFQEIECRRLYHCKIRDIATQNSAFAGENVYFSSLAAVSKEEHSMYREQILCICKEVFLKGYSRYFTDPVLLERQPGIAYILAMMQLNFERVPPSHFLIAVDRTKNRVCGFSVIGKKSGFEEAQYTQLLSAVQKTYQGQGIYRGLTRCLSKIMPQHAMLLNVTHEENLAIQQAYQKSGRVHLADTVVMRKLYHTVQ